MKNKNIYLHPAFLISTCFGIGKIPFASGTWGSLFAVLFFLLTSDYIVLIILLIFPAMLIGIYATDKYLALIGSHGDPKEVVIDEFIGQLITIIITLTVANYVLAASTEDLKIRFVFSENSDGGFNLINFSAVLSFVLFRFFDILKPFPISWFDSNIDGGRGVMVDDVVAGIIAGLTSALVFLAL